MPFIPPIDPALTALIAAAQTVGAALGGFVGQLSGAIFDVHRFHALAINRQATYVLRLSILAATQVPDALAVVNAATSQEDYSQALFILYQTVSVADVSQTRADKILDGIASMADQYGDPRPALRRKRVLLTNERNAIINDPLQIERFVALTRELQDVIQRLADMEEQLSDLTALEARLLAAHAALGSLARSLRTQYVKPLSTFRQGRLILAGLVALAV